MSEETLHESPLPEEEPITTRQKLLYIIEEMEQAGSIMTISGVARAAGMSHTNIILRYNDLAVRIRESAGVVKETDAKKKLAQRSGTIKEERAMRARLRVELDETKELLRKVNSVNATLLFKVDSLEGELAKERSNHKHRTQIAKIHDTVSKPL